jgi:hypothetical protein
MATRSGSDESAVPGLPRTGILKLDPAADTEDEELDFELDFQRSLTTAQRFDLMFRRSREMVELLRSHGHGNAASIVKRA